MRNIFRPVMGDTLYDLFAGRYGGAVSSLFSVLDSDGNSFSVPLSVLDSDGNSFTILSAVLDSDGNSFTPI